MAGALVSPLTSLLPWKTLGGKATIEVPKYYARAWFSHRGAMARINFGSKPQCHVEICVPLCSDSERSNERAFARAKALAVGRIISLELHK